MVEQDQSLTEVKQHFTVWSWCCFDDVKKIQHTTCALQISERLRIKDVVGTKCVPAIKLLRDDWLLPGYYLVPAFDSFWVELVAATIDWEVFIDWCDGCLWPAGRLRWSKDPYDGIQYYFNRMSRIIRKWQLHLEKCHWSGFEAVESKKELALPLASPLLLRGT